MADPFIAEIIMFGGNFAPRGWALCEGQILPINQNQSLFSLLGTTYGGDGRTTFALPDLRGRIPIGAGHGTGLTNRTLGAKGGLQSMALATSQIPAHTHVGDASAMDATLSGQSTFNADSTQPDPSNVLSKTNTPIDVLAYSDSDVDLADVGGAASVNPTVSNTGASQGHENRQPLLAVNYIIALQGVFPSRN